MWTPHACVRKLSKGWEEIETFGSLTTEAMTVTLTTEEEREVWLHAPWE